MTQQHQGTARNRHVEALATGVVLYSDTSHISLSSDTRLLENWRTKIDWTSSHPSRISHLPWQGLGTPKVKLIHQNIKKVTEI